MKQVKEDFIGIVVEEMKNTKLFTQEEMVYALVVLEQRLEEYESFLKDLEKNKDNLYVYIDKEEEDYYELLTIHIGFSKDYSYDIIIKERDEMIGYCMCERTDEGYNKKYNCCGVECDWYRPCFFLKKVEYIGMKVDFVGLQKDLWNAIEKFKDKYFEKEYTKQQEQENKRNQLSREVDYYKRLLNNLQEQLKELE